MNIKPNYIVGNLKLWSLQIYVYGNINLKYDGSHTPALIFPYSLKISLGKCKYKDKLGLNFDSFVFYPYNKKEGVAHTHGGNFM